MSLNENGIQSELVEDVKAAYDRLLEIIPGGAEVMVMSSETLSKIGFAEEVEKEGGRYRSVKKILSGMDREKESLRMNQIGAAPEWAVGSVHGVTEDGSLLIASNTGSQIPAYAYGAENVVWVVGAQKIVKDSEEGLKRLYEYSFPLEDARARKAYNSGSGVNKILIVNKEKMDGRSRLIFINREIGF